MDEKPYTVLTVRMPTNLQAVLETLSSQKGELVSTIIRDLVRSLAVADDRHVDRGIMAASPVNSRDYK